MGMGYKKVFFYVVVVTVMVAGVLVAIKTSNTKKQSELKQVAIASQDLVFYTNDKQVETLSVDVGNTGKSGKNTDLASNRTADIQVWIE